MTMISDLSEDLVEEILSRVPITYRGRVRSTCKGWNLISNDQSFIKKHCGKVAKELLVTMIDDSGACLMNVNLQNPKDFNSSIKRLGKFNGQVEISDVLHCNGLLLCIPRDDTRPLVVCNPYLGQVRLIQPIKINPDILYVYAIGYDNRNNHKILRLFESYYGSRIVEYEMYDFETNSWKVIEDTPNWFIWLHCNGKSLKGYTYFVAYNLFELFLIYFDFTREKFGPRLRLPFQACHSDPFTLSTVREEQLAVSLFSWGEIEIWITAKIEPDAVSWIPFLKVETPTRPITRFWFPHGTFFFDEKKKVAGIFGENIDDYSRTNASVYGEDGYYKVMDLGTSETRTFWCSYVPSSVQIQ